MIQYKLNIMMENIFKICLIRFITTVPLNYLNYVFIFTLLITIIKIYKI